MIERVHIDGTDDSFTSTYSWSQRSTSSSGITSRAIGDGGQALFPQVRADFGIPLYHAESQSVRRFCVLCVSSEHLSSVASSLGTCLR